MTPFQPFPWSLTPPEAMGLYVQCGGYIDGGRPPSPLFRVETGGAMVTVGRARRRESYIHTGVEPTP